MAGIKGGDCTRGIGAAACGIGAAAIIGACGITGGATFGATATGRS